MKRIRRLSEARQAAEVLAQCFGQEPNITWMIPAQERPMRWFFASIVADSMAKGGAYLSDNGKGVLLLYDWQNRRTSLRAVLLKVRAALFVLGLRRTQQLLHLQRIKRRYQPATGLYGMALAVLPDSDRWRTGMDLKKGFENIRQATQQPIFAETTIPRVVKLYEHLGLDIYYQMPHPFVPELTVYFMDSSATRA